MVMEVWESSQSASVDDLGMLSHHLLEKWDAHR